MRQNIAEAARRAGRNPSDVKLIAVSKTHPPVAIRRAMSLGQRFFGENKVQEGESKIAEIGRDAEWHLIGHLQKNKARRAVQLFDVIHSVDSVEIALRLDRICNEEGRNELPVLVQVDLAGEATKSGVPESGLTEVVNAVRGAQNLSLRGLMILPPYFDDPEMTRPYFHRLRVIRDRLAAEGAFNGRAGELSMGMSHDFEVAIEEGATMVRVGSAIFGERRHAGSL